MTSGPRGPTAGPLDLRAVEVHFKAALDGDDISGTYMEALLAHCRALRAALRAFLDLPYPVESPEVVDTLRQAVVVLAQATDGETPTE